MNPLLSPSRLRPVILLPLLLLFACIRAFGGDTLVASVDRDRLAVNETLELTVEWRGAARSQPDFSALEHQFEVLGTRQSSQTSMSGVNVDTVTRWHLTLLPKETGELIIPSFRFEQSISEALTVTVTEADTTARAERRFWLESVVDREQARVGEQILLTYRLYYASHLRQMTRDDVSVEGADVVPLRERQFQTVIEGVRFQVAELRFAVFATREGPLEIPPLRLDGYSSEGSDPRFGGLIRGLGNPVRLSSESHRVDILPRPAGTTSGNWLPARGVSLSERWSNGDQPIRVGEPVTRTVRIDAQGVKAQQLPELDFGAQEGYRVYPEQPRLQHREDQSGLMASRTESHALIASRPGPLTLPAVRVQWWDTETGQLRETVLEGRTLEVLPAADSPMDSEQQISTTGQHTSGDDQPSRTNAPWLWLSLALNLLLLIALLYLWQRQGKSSAHRPRTGHSNVAGPGRRQLERRMGQYVKAGDYRAFRNTLLEWSHQMWPDDAPHTLSRIAILTDRPELARLLHELDRALYDTNVQVTEGLGKRILAELKSVDATRHHQGSSGDLPPLYR